MFSDNLQILKELPSPVGNWELVEVIGEGNYGQVFKARNLQTGVIAAAKVMEAILDKEEDIKAELNVFENHSHHPNIVNYFGSFVKKDSLADDQLWIVMEYCPAGSVTDLVKEMKEKGEQLSEDMISYILREVLSGLSYMHSACLLHRDVKGQNVLLTNEGRVKLIDFGISAIIDSPTGKRRTTIGTPYWMAPEVIACESQLDMEYDARADVWSLGITAIEIADSTPPLFGENPMRALLKIPKNKSPTVQNPFNWSDNFNHFVTQCLHKDYEQRPTTAQLLSHKFVFQVPKEPRIVRRKLIGLLETYRQEKESIFSDSSTSTSTVDTMKNLQALSTLNTVDDLATLEFIDETVIVSQLWKRYRKKLIYTNVGDILVSINPFQQLDIYTEKFSYLYCHATHSHLPPHIFAIAGSAYRTMVYESQDQCCVVSGESGAGKTEASNLLVQQFMKLGKARNRSLEEKILKINPLIESFGNAKTIINENSSRFGKYLELRFTSDGHVVGAHLSEYLLEKSRVVSQARREKNFHIFYYLLAGLSARKRMKEFRLSSVYHHQHRYLEHRGTHKVNIKKDALFKERFDLIDNAFRLFGFTREEFECVCRILAAVLNLGDIRIESHTHNYLGEVSAIPQLDKVEDVAYLLRIDSEELEKALTSSQVVTHGEIIVKPTTIEQAMDTRDAVAKALYGRMFSWIVNRINPALDATNIGSSKIHNIGILDIFGFENIRTNSFEQLCINIANEQLQFYFNQHVFAWEQEEYEREGVALSLVAYMDNRPLLELLLTIHIIQRPIGLLALLDEESKFPRATDLSLAEKFHTNFKSSSYYKQPKDGGPTFTVLHYAAPVTYETVGFLEKNRDTLKSDVSKLLMSSSDQIVHSMFYTPLSRTGGLSVPSRGGGASSATPLFSRRAPFGDGDRGGYGRHGHHPTNPRDRTPLSSSGTLTTNRAQTVSTYFINSLRELMSKMLLGKAHFVRCIRPNEMKTPGQFQADKVLVQLRYTGVLETTRIRREGFSHRISFEDFLERYKVISFPLCKSVSASPTNCVQILMQAGLEKWVTGKTKVFLKYHHVERLTQLLSSYHRSAITIQRVVRGWMGRQVAAVLRRERRERAALSVQTAVRGFLARRLYWRILEHREKSAVRIQAVIRGWMARSHYLRFLHKRQMATLIIQTATRRWLAQQHVQQLKRKQEEEADGKDIISWNRPQHAIATIEIKKLEEEQQLKQIEIAYQPLRSHPSQEDSTKQEDTPTRMVAKETSRFVEEPVATGYYDNIQQSSTSTPPTLPSNKYPSYSSSLSTTRMLFENLITRQREASSSPQRLKGHGKMQSKDGHQRVKEKKPRKKNPNSIIHQLLVRFDPGSFVTIQQVQS